jgi:hypothetical protein
MPNLACERSGWLSFLAVCFALLGAAPAVAQPLGDFGRPKPSLFEGLIPKQFWKGPVEPQSSFPLTGLEVELRDRSYALIRPNEPRGKWNIYIAEFQLAHMFPPEFDEPYDYTEYGRMLLQTLARSEASSYNRLIEDMAADGALVAPFVRVACTIYDLDTKRQQSLAYVTELTREETGNAIGRMRENRLTTEWVRRSLYQRLGSYRYALERLVISVPSRLAVDAERMHKRFEAIVVQADPELARCAGEEFRTLRRGVPLAAGAKAPVVWK